MPCLMQGASPDAPPRAQVIPRVTGTHGCSYSLYLPSTYSESRPCPVLFCFSPVGDGEGPVRLFRAAAEAHGFMVVGSHEVRNGPLAPALAAQDKLWKEVVDRYAIDSHRCYAAGLSGGARMALRFARRHARQISGVISFGAFGDQTETFIGLGHMAFFLACGLEDFAHWEMVQGSQDLRARGIATWATSFSGGHQWPDVATASDALAFMALAHAKGMGRTPPEDGFLARQLAKARELESGGEPLRAHRLLANLVSWLPEGPDLLTAKAAMKRLEGRPDLQRERDLERAFEETYRNGFGIRSAPAMARHLEALRVDLLGGDPLRALNAKRAMGAPLLQQVEALSTHLERAEWGQALDLARALVHLVPMEPRYQVYAACAASGAGRKAEALAHLQAAVQAGYQNRRALERLAEGWLAGIREEPAFTALLVSLPPSQAPGD